MKDNKNNNGFKVTVGAGSFLAFILSLITVFLAATFPESRMISMLIPVLTGYILVREGPAWFAAALFWTAIFAVAHGPEIWMIFPGIFTVVTAFSIHSVYSFRNTKGYKTHDGVILLTLIDKLKLPWTGVLSFCMASLLAIMISLFAYESITGNETYEIYNKSIDNQIVLIKNMAEEQKKSVVMNSAELAQYDELVSQTQTALDTARDYLPSVIFIAAAVSGVLIYFITRSVYKATGLNVPNNARLSELIYPPSVMNGVLGILLLFMLAKWAGVISNEAGIMNLILMAFIVFSFSGAASIMRITGRLPLGRFIGYVLIFLFFVFTGSTLLGIIGIISTLKVVFDASGKEKL